ncbi:unnamed protein product [Brachionus calyciflorus]|uniref:GTP-binding protein 10 n=1 Tax=Brachionus calyciflorus TaxID=104777 RepID=A0A813MZK7_9BILA|nr:unnamed protein product [Brachionus calyciflorus]
MVFLSPFMSRIKSYELGKHLKRSFIDRLRVYLKSGTGGKGLPKLGGIGGDGGSIYIQAKNNINLKQVYSANLRKRYIAGDGESSKKLKLYGANGQDIVIDVPCGVTVETDSGAKIGEVNTEGEKLIIAKGGKGGSPLNDYKSEQGQAFSVNLDLKLIADIGLIGFPNAGKSTFLSLVSRARPKIANYPFTTLQPQLGTIEYDDKRVITLADLPGLIEGAHYNRGMGHKFLKHVSRTKINVFMVDINGFQLNPKFDARDAFETVVFLNKELEMYDSSLVQKPSILVLNKMDTENSRGKYDRFMELFENYENSIQKIEEYWRPIEKINFESIFKISAKTNMNIEEVCLEFRELIDELDERNRLKSDKKSPKILQEFLDEN